MVHCTMYNISIYEHNVLINVSILEFVDHLKSESGLKEGSEDNMKWKQDLLGCFLLGNHNSKYLVRSFKQIIFSVIQMSAIYVRIKL